MWTDIASIVFICVTANHLGLVKAVEMVTRCNRLPIVGCVKCSAFWATVAYMVFTGRWMVSSLAISFLSSYAAIWLELFEGMLDTVYLKVYEKIIPETNADTSAAGSTNHNTDGPVPEL